jgi:hypothetical protein
VNTLEKICVDKLEKPRRLTHETKTIWDIRVEIIPVIVSSLGAVHAQSLQGLKPLILYEDKTTKKMGRRLSEAAIAVSLQLWRGYAQDMMDTVNP